MPITPRFKWRVYMDWNGDDFWERDATPSDRANALATPLDLSTHSYEASGTSTVSIVEGFGARTRYGNEYFGVVTSGAGEGINIFKSGATYEQTTTNTTRYTVVCWIRYVSGLAATQVIQAQLVSNSGATIEVYKDVPLEGFVTNQWTRVELGFTASASNNMFLKVVVPVATAVTYHITGLMLFTGTTTIPYGFNTGLSPRGYDEISSDLRSMNWFLGLKRPYQDVCDEQTALITVYNGDGKYSPENPNSMITGRVHNGFLCSIEYTLENEQGYSQMYVGRADFANIQWAVGPQSAKMEVSFPFTWYMKLMRDTQVDIPLLTNIPASTIISRTLGVEYGFDLPVNLIDTSVSTIANYGDSNNLNLWQIIVDITGAERGRFFISRDGRGTWWNRQHLSLLNTVDYAIDTSEPSAYPPMMLDYKYGSLYTNTVRIRVNPRQTGSSETLWELDSTVTVEAGATEYLWTPLRRSNGQYASSSALTPSGATYSSGTMTITVDEYGGRAKITLDNSLGAIPAVLTGLTLAGAPQIKQNAIEYSVSVDSADLAQYGRYELAVNIDALTTGNDAKDIANYELTRRSTFAGDVLSISYKHPSDGVENYHQYMWQIGDRVTLTAPELYHAKDYFIIGEEHSLAISDRWMHQTTFYLEPADTNAFWLIGVAGFGEIGETTRLGY